MSIRVLIIDDEDVYRRLLSQHVSVGFDEPAIELYDPSTLGRLPQDFDASRFDVVLLDDEPGDGSGMEWLRDLAGRTVFPPVVYLLSAPSGKASRAARDAGAHACLSKQKIDHKALVGALRTARKAGPRRPSPEPAPGTEETDRACRFGGRTIRGFRFVRKLAENPVSAVYLAERVSNGEQVALKVLGQAPDGEGRNSEDFGRFLREYEIASAIRHPNVVRIYDFGASDEYAYIAMEYFPAGDLRARIKAGIEPLNAARLLREMAEALGVLHAAGVLHRDLKPGNVMLREDGSVVLIDFGFAKQLELDASFTGRGAIFGTPYYMSPEQGHGRDTDERSDLYSLGVIFYEMLMRRKPYVAGTPMKVIYKHANAPLPELPPPLRRFEPVLYKCIAKDPAHRYASAGKLVEAIRELERDEAESAAMG